MRAQRAGTNRLIEARLRAYDGAIKAGASSEEAFAMAKQLGARKRHPAVAKIRAAIKHIDGAWVRRWRDGAIWVGARYITPERSAELRAAVEAAGFRVVVFDRPGTEGHLSLDVYELEASP